MKKKQETGEEISSKNKIKKAAKSVFLKKGYSATRTRDIAQEAGINLALLNYYFRSKENLFHEIMLESTQGLFATIALVFNDKETGFYEKIEQMSNQYITWLCKEPEMPLFIMSELRSNAEGFIKSVHVKEMLLNSLFYSQFQELNKSKSDKIEDFMQFFMNLMGLLVFPFIASPIIRHIGELDEKAFVSMLEQRKALIPIWVKSILNTK